MLKSSQSHASDVESGAAHVDLYFLVLPTARLWKGSGNLNEAEHVLDDVVHESWVLALDLVPAVHLAQSLPVLQSGKWADIPSLINYSHSDSSVQNNAP